MTSDAGGKVVAEDAVGNKSEPTKIIAGKDTFAPDVPLVEVNKEGTTVEGQTEPNAKVQIKDADGKVIELVPQTHKVSFKSRFRLH